MRSVLRSVSIVVLSVALSVGWLPPTGPAPAQASASVQPLTPGCAGAPAGRFVDVEGTHQAGIDCIGWWGVTQGVGASRYDPRGAVQRDQMASFLASALSVTGGGLPANAPDAFRDDTGNRHEPAINQLAAANIVGGVAPGRFAPERIVRRGQMATFLAAAWEHHTGRALPTSPPGHSGFSDTASSVHAGNIERVAAVGIASGYPDGTFDPEAPVTRAQMGTFLARFIAALVATGNASYPPAQPVALPPSPPDPRTVNLGSGLPRGDRETGRVLVQRQGYVPSVLVLTEGPRDSFGGPSHRGAHLFAWDGTSYQRRASENFDCWFISELSTDHGGVTYLGCTSGATAHFLYAIHPGISSLRVFPSASSGWLFDGALRRTARSGRPDDLRLGGYEYAVTGGRTGRIYTHTLSWNGRVWEAVSCTNADGSSRRISPPIDARNPSALGVCG